MEPKNGNRRGERGVKRLEVTIARLVVEATIGKSGLRIGNFVTVAKLSHGNGNYVEVNEINRQFGLVFPTMAHFP